MKTFKQKAVFSAVASAAAMLAGNAGAVNVNTDGLGEALIYPYYTTRNGAATLMSVVNTTNTAKAVKVRIMEGKNTAEVLDFNLFLSPYDVWTAAITVSADGTVGQIATADKSCTNPAIYGVGPIAFKNGAYSNDVAALRTLDRTREGYIELIEMATIDSESATAADVTHNSSGTPTCSLTKDAKVAANAGDYSLPTGGLFGAGTLVGNSMSTGYNATALEGLGYTGGVTSSGTVLPNLGSGTNTSAVVLDSPVSATSRITVANFATAIDAVSAVMMHSAVMGEYAYDSTLGTDWVITMPTKRQYVNGTAPVAPFQRIWNGKSTAGDGTACVDVTISSYDREEQSSTSPDEFSPTTQDNVPQLCYESTVVSFDAATSGASSVLGSTNVAHYKAYQNSATSGGWAELVFGNAISSYTPKLGALASSQTTLVTAGTIGTPSTGAVTFTGLPAIGFAVSAAKFTTSSNNYNSSYNLAFKRTIQ